MLYFSPFPRESPLQQEATFYGLEIFPDHLNPHLVYILPKSISLAISNGKPEFFLLRYNDDFSSTHGGLMHLSLGYDPLPATMLQLAPTDNWSFRQIAFSAARLRLILRTLLEGEDDQVGVWHPVLATGEFLRTPNISLESHETSLLLDLLNNNQPNVIEIQIEGCYTGLVAGIPWLITADAKRLWTHLNAVLPADGAYPDQVVAIFQSMPQSQTSSLSWMPLESNTKQPELDELQTEIAWRALKILFECQPHDDPFAKPRYRLIAENTLPVKDMLWDLRQPRLEQRCCLLNWSLNQFFNHLSAEARAEIFPIVRNFSPFQWIDIHVINGLPFDSAYLQRVLIDLRYAGLNGGLEFRTLTFDGNQDVQTVRIFFPTSNELNLSYRVTTVLASSDGLVWPKIHTSNFMTAYEPVIVLEKTTIGMDFVRVSAEPTMFDLAKQINVLIWHTDALDNVTQWAVKLDATRPSAWVALPDPERHDKLQASVIAIAAHAEQHLEHKLRHGPLIGRELHLAAYELEALEPTLIRLRLNLDTASLFAYVAVIMATPLGHENTITLDSSSEQIWNLFRSNVFEPINYRYRIEYVSYDVDGKTLPLTRTDWQNGISTDLLISPPVNEAIPT